MKAILDAYLSYLMRRSDEGLIPIADAMAGIKQILTAHEGESNGMLIFEYGGKTWGINLNKEISHYGWICYKHPDGQWVSWQPLPAPPKEGE